MSKQYKAREGAKFNDEQAQVYGKRLNHLTKKKGGKLQPIDIIKDAINKSSPLHDYFEWDDSEASKKYRIQQARELISHIVEFVVVEGVVTKQRSWFSVSDKEKKEPVYVTLKTAVDNTDYRRDLINNVIKHLENTTVLLKLLRGYET